MPYLAYSDQNEEKKLNLDGKERILIGRESDCELAFPGNTTISRYHCVLLNNPKNGFTIADMKSTNGTRVNGTQITAETILKDGDEIQIGNLTLHFSNPKAAGETSAPPSIILMRDERDFPFLHNEKVDHYTIKRLLYSTPQFDIYSVLPDSNLCKLTMVFCKVPQPDPESFELFRRLLKQTKPIQTENVVTAFESGLYNGKFCYYTCLLPETVRLNVWISNKAPVHEQKVLELTNSIAELIAYAEKVTHLAHGTLEPAKILLRANHQPIICDYGLSEWLSLYTAGGVAAASIWYISPEQIGGTEPDWRSDLYSLGIIMFQMLTGVLPFHAEEEEEVLGMHLNMPFPRPSDRNLNVRISEKTVALLEKMTQKNPSDRFASWDEFLKALTDAATTLKILQKMPKVQVFQESSSVQNQAPVQNQGVRITKSKILIRKTGK